MESFEQFFLESFNTALKTWSKSNDPHEVEQYIDIFKTLKARQIIKGAEGDISPWIMKSFQDFKKFVDQRNQKLQQLVSQKELEAGATKVFENEKCIVVVPHTWEASCKYGAGTKWCTTSKATNRHWKSYTEQGVKFYYILTKDKQSSDTLYKVAIAVYTHQAKTTPTLEAYNAVDQHIKPNKFLAQYNIPLTLFTNIWNANEWLKTIKHTIDKNGFVNVEENVKLNNFKLNKLPFKFGVIKGHFYCSNNQLTSLQGAPKEIEGHFNCSNNQLTSLQGAPEKVKGYFDCSSNQLTSLQGAPKEVEGYFDCSSNQLTSLQGAPKEVEGHFYCSNNQLTSLQGAPEKAKGYFDCYNNQLTSLQGAPKEIEGHFNCSNNQLTSLQGAPEKVKGYFYCSNNQLTSLQGAPKEIEGHFNCYNNQFNSNNDDLKIARETSPGRGFENYIMNESLKKLGKLKLSKPRDALSSFRFNSNRGMNRKNLRQIPTSHAANEPSSYSKSLPQFIHGLDISNKIVNIAKKAPSGVWRISKEQALDIAKKYKFNVPNEAKPMKHLGSTGIQVIRFKSNVFYLYKPHRAKRHRKPRKGTSKSYSMFKGI